MNRNMRKKSKGKIALIILAVITMVLLVVALVQCLWNWLLPDIFGLKEISYWQAFGLFILAKLLFGGKPGKPGGFRGRCNENTKSEEMDDISAEDRDRLREEWKRRFRDKCGF